MSEDFLAAGQNSTLKKSVRIFTQPGSRAAVTTIGRTTGVPQIAADLPRRPSWQGWANCCHWRRAIVAGRGHMGQADNMIVLFMDFRLHGPYTGQMKAVLHQMAPGMPAIDLFADAPVGNPKASAYLLAVYAAWFPVGTVFLCIVDPGVGGTRPAIVLEADGRWYVGPGNGLFELVQRRARKTRSWDIDWKPERLSAGFHGRDLFAPVAA